MWCCSGIGGEIVDGTVVAHRVKKQSTVVQMGASLSGQAGDLLTSVDARLRRKPEMLGWLGPHAVFIAAMASVILHEDRTSMRARFLSARHPVAEMREGNAEPDDWRRWSCPLIFMPFSGDYLGQSPLLTGPSISRVGS